MYSIFYILWLCLLAICKIRFIDGLDFEEGDQCTIQDENIQGNSATISKCSWALARINQKLHVEILGFNGVHPIVCCPLNQKNDSGQHLNNSSGQSHNSIKHGENSTSWSISKCEQMYPPSAVYIVGAGGRKSGVKEFPHMAILGYGNETVKEWRCGGSLIDYQHILTAAHCVESTDFGEVKYVRLGDLDIQNDTDDAEPQDFYVKLAVAHPDFDPSTLKHDIALLVLDKPVSITDYVQPGCLFPGGNIADNNLITATGWGITQIAGPPSSHLIKVDLKEVNHTECKRQYERAGTRGKIDEDIQICAGSAHVGKIIDTCEGDSGGPLQFKSFQNQIHYVIFGVTSFGKACGITKSAGVYTRVSPYLPWIQSIVENKS